MALNVAIPFLFAREGGNMKLFRVASIMLAFFVCAMISLSAYAAPGDPNIDTGGGGMGTGTSQNFWNTGNEGVRVTVVRASDHAVVTTPIDLTNRPPASGIYHFGRVSKIQYTNGNSLSFVRGGYVAYSPKQPIPRIISSSTGSNNIEAIRRYFSSEYLVMLIADLTGMDFNILTNGDYRLLLEPIAYFRFQGVDIAMTATEAALYDQVLSGGLRSRMQALTHRNLPLAMFLERSDLGFPAWTGSRTSAASNADIISSLGLGIVRFTEQLDELVLETIDYEYRVNTEVITAVKVSGGQSDPDRPTRVTFNINGVAHNVGNVYYPAGDSQLAWVRWTTPSTPQYMTITVTATGPGSTARGTINVRVVDLDENPPPNPVARDRNDSFVHAPVPDRVQQTSASWDVWRPWWRSHWVWHRSRYGGWWCDHGWWEFSLDRHSASLTGEMSITPDQHNPTAGDRIMKSGYGINQIVTTDVRSTQTSATTSAQNAVSYFPEFKYEQFWRLLELTGDGNSTQFQFQQNKYSTFRNRTHFTPVWMPDGDYTVNTWLIDSWTPAGMLSMNLIDSLTIRGSLWDDWHIAPLSPR